MTDCTEAKARLIIANSGTKRHTFQWVVTNCPYCDKKHYHGAGDDPREVKRFLGSRTPHCLNRPAGNPDYILVWDIENPFVNKPKVHVLPLLEAMGVSPRIVSTGKGTSLTWNEEPGEHWRGRLIGLYRARIIEELTARMVEDRRCQDGE